MAKFDFAASVSGVASNNSARTRGQGCAIVKALFIANKGKRINKFAIAGALRDLGLATISPSTCDMQQSTKLVDGKTYFVHPGQPAELSNEQLETIGKAIVTAARNLAKNANHYKFASTAGCVEV